MHFFKNYENDFILDGVLTDYGVHERRVMQVYSGSNTASVLLTLQRVVVG